MYGEFLMGSTKNTSGLINIHIFTHHMGAGTLYCETDICVPAKGPAP